VHPEQEERFEVIEGKMKFRIGDEDDRRRGRRRGHRGRREGPQVLERRRRDSRGSGRGAAALRMEKLFETAVQLAED